jgi:cytochrome P450
MVGWGAGLRHAREALELTSRYRGGQAPAQLGRGRVTMSVDSTGYDPAAVLDPETARHPQPFYALQRSVGPIVAGAFGGYQLVTKETVEQAFQNPAIFSSAMEAVDLGQSVPLIPLQVDPPEHRKYRRLLDPIFAPKKMNQLEGDICDMVNGLIDAVVDQPGCELTETLTVPLPSQVFLRLLGLPLSELDMFLAMKDGILHPGGDDFDAMRARQVKAAAEVEAYFAAALAERKEHPQDDILSMFLAAEVDGARLSDDEILGICFLFIIAGLDTVTDTLECFFAFLAEHPEHRRRIVEDPSIIPAAVEELLRWETPVTGVARVAAEDTVVAGCPVARGTSVGVSIGSANTDPAAYEHADVVDFGRNPKHYAFGGGVHRCLGSHLARLELRIVLKEWHRRIPEYSIAPGTELVVSPGLRQFSSLPLVFG